MSTRTGAAPGVGVGRFAAPLLRLQGDERLIAQIRAGSEPAFDCLFARYRPRLLAFCRHMLGSTEDAEDVMQDVFVNAYNAIRADNRAINARPWLYRIARNRCLNHLRRPVPVGRDTMDDFTGAGGISTAEIAHRRADLRQLLEDVQKLPETQRTALLLREIDVLSYDQIADAMQTTVSSVKSLLVRARMALAEASEARALTCDDVRLRLAEAIEGIGKVPAPVRRHVRECDDCRAYKKMLRKTNSAMAMAFPVGPLMVLKKLLVAKLGFAVGHGGSAAGAAAGGGAVAGGAAAGAGSAASAGIAAVATKAAVGLALTALVAGGAVEANKAVHPRGDAAKKSAPAPAVPTGGVSAQEAERVEAAEDEKAKREERANGEDSSQSDSTASGEESGSNSGDGSGATAPGDAGAGGQTGTPGSEPALPGTDDVSPVTGGSGSPAPDTQAPTRIEP